MAPEGRCWSFQVLVSLYNDRHRDTRIITGNGDWLRGTEMTGGVPHLPCGLAGGEGRAGGLQ